MKLIIDCFKLIKGEGKSVGIYNVAADLVRGLGESCPEDWSITVFGNRYNRIDMDWNGVDFVEIKQYDPLKRRDFLLWELFGAARAFSRYKGDVILFPRGYRPLFFRGKDIVLIHDMIPFYYDEYYPGVFGRVENAYIMNRLRSSARRAWKVVTISQSSKQDIEKYAGVDGKKINVIYDACREPGEYAYNDGRYICAITSGLPHKNSRGIFKSYVEYCRICEDPLDLVVIGVDKPASGYIEPDIIKRITCHKFIKSTSDLYSKIAGAEAFLFLSYKEGFGLPPIEAMQLGVPVVCSDRSSLPEVVGDAALLTDPDDYESVAQKLRELTTTPTLQEELIKKGHENCKRFELSDIARAYWKVICPTKVVD